jgi:hypothetical protein
MEPAMRPAASRVVTLWITVVCLLAAFMNLDGLGLAQSAAGSKRQLSQRTPQAPIPAASGVRPAKKNAPPPLTTDTWTGGGGSGDTGWSDGSNWNTGGITSGDNVLINLTTAATVDDYSVSIGTLTLSKAGDSVTVANNVSLYVDGNISNAGTITLDAASGGNTYLNLTGNSTLSGSGTLVLGSASTTNVLQSAASGITLTNQSTIEGVGTIGSGYGLTLNNSGTINANVSGQQLYVETTASSNTGTLEATNGGTLVINGYYGSWNNTGGNITAATGSAVVLNGQVTITGGSLSTSGTGIVYGADASLVGVTNTGNFVIQNNNYTNMSGTITNTGTITLEAATGGNTYLNLNGNTTLTGSGTVVLGSASTTNVLQSSVYDVTLTNQSTIEGVGTIGSGYDLILNNSGTVNANVSGQQLYVQTTASTNTGTLEATNGGTLVINGYYGSWTNTGGNITAAAGSVVWLDGNVTITGGTLNGSGTGIVYGADTTLVGVTLEGNFQVPDNYTTNIQGTINNTGTITLASVANDATNLYVTSAGATLTGGGTVIMGAGAQYANIGGFSGGSFTNSNNTIEGTGTISNSGAVVNNGTIDANVSPTVLNALLQINSNTGITNTSVLEATNGGTLYIVDSTLTNTGSGAVIKALGSDTSGNASNVQFNGVTVNGGTLETSGAGVIYAYGGTVLDNVTNTGTLVVPDGNTAYISGTINNTGTITVDAMTGSTYLDIDGNTTLTGTGTLVLGSAYTGNNLQATASGTILTNQSTIEGEGTIGGGNTLILNNSATVDANVSGQQLWVQTTASSNTGTLEATNGGTLVLNGYYGSWTNTGGNITAANASAVVLNGGVTITGGTLSTSGTGIVYGANTYLVGVSNTGNFEVANNSYTDISGTITNTGTITLEAASGGNTYLNVTTSNATLTGSGTLVLGSGGTGNNIQATASGNTLTNQSTIEGMGTIGGGNTLVLKNTGTINANVSGQQLLVQIAAGSTNTSTMEATNGGTLFLDGYYSGGVGWTNTGGNITAAAASAVVLYDNMTVTGGTLNGSGTGIVYGDGANLVGLATEGNFVVQDGYTTTLSGTIDNTGTITVGSVNGANLNLAGNTTLTGSGKVIFTNSNMSGGYTFTNSGNTIEGYGNIGNNDSIVTNKSGSMIANVSGQTLNIDSAYSSTGTTNDGTMEATNGGSLMVGNALTNYNSTTNALSGGTYIANGGDVYLPLGSSGGITTLSASVTEENGGLVLNSNDGYNNALAGLTSITSTGALTIGGVAFTDSGAFSNAGSLTILAGESFTVGSLTQISGTSLTAGTYVLDANLNLSGATETITTNAAHLTLAGGTIENANSTNALAGLAKNTGSLTIDAAIKTTASSFSNTGTLTVGKSASFTAKSLTQISSGTLTAGTYVLSGNLDLTTKGISVTTNAAKLTLEGGTINSNGVNALSALAANTGSLTIDATVSTTAASFSNTGTLTIDKGETFTVPALTQITTTGGVTTLTAGTYVLAGTLDSTTAENITVNAANLTLEGGGIKTGTTNDLANLNSNTGTLTVASDASVTTSTTATFANSGSVDVQKGSTLTVGGTGHSYSQTAGTTTADGTLSAGTSGTVSLTGGTILGAGTVKGNTTNTSGTFSAGDAGKAGLLSITGSYTQLSSGTLNANIGGTVLSTQYSQLKISGTASLGGTLAVTLINSFTPAIGNTFTILSAKSITGTFSNTTIAINSSEQFDISYTSTGVVLTVVSTADLPSNPASLAVSTDPKQTVNSPKNTTVSAKSTLSHAVTGIGKRVEVASLGHGSAPVSGAILATPRIWEHVPVAPSWDHVKAVTVGQRAVNLGGASSDLAHHVNLWTGTSHAVAPIQSPVIGRTGSNNSRRIPVHTLPTALPVIR